MKKKTKDQIRVIVEDYVSARVMEFVFSMDSLKSRDYILDLLEQEDIKDFDYIHEMGKVPFLENGSKKLTKELTDYIMSKFI